MTSHVIITQSAREVLIEAIKAHRLPFTVSITAKEKRSDKQNRLQHKWMSEIAEQRGDVTPEEVRGYCKEHFGVPIRCNEPTEDGDYYRQQYEKHIARLPYETRLALMMKPFDFPVTRDMSPDQMAQYLDEVSRAFSSIGIVLTEPRAFREEAKKAAQADAMKRAQLAAARAAA